MKGAGGFRGGIENRAKKNAQIEKEVRMEKEVQMEKGENQIRVAFHTLGCKVNSYETEVMQQAILKKGYRLVDFEEEAEVYIINTCSVTNIADRKSRQMLHKAREKNPAALIIAAGCYAQTRGEEELLLDGVDLVVGNNKKSQIGDIVENRLSMLEDIAKESSYEDMQLESTTDHTRCFIKIQDGCNQFCSYCIIPFARGRVRSRRQEEICQEVERLAGKGYREFVLTGIHLSSYGMDLVPREEADKNNWLKYNRLINIIERIAAIEGVDRIRLGSLEPRIITEEFADRLSRIKKLCPHFHLSLQSGCDETLRRMNRHYDGQEYYHGLELLRESFLRQNGCLPAITTDVIVGFPGETEEEFEKSRAFIEKCGFYETHIFKYSKRKNTRAALMEGQLTDRQKSERSEVLRKLNEEKQRTYIEYICGGGFVSELLVEETVEIDGKQYFTGFTKEYIRAIFEYPQDICGKIVRGRLELSEKRLAGQLICNMTQISVK